MECHVRILADLKEDTAGSFRELQNGLVVGLILRNR